MHRTQILLEPAQHAELSAIAGREQRSLAAAAEALLADYRDDPELSAFAALDAEDVNT